MKGIFILAILLLTFGGSVSAQSFLDEIVKARKIKLLEAGINKVEEIFADGSFQIHGSAKPDAPTFDPTRPSYLTFFKEDVIIQAKFSTGDCANDAEDWNVPAGKVTEISVSMKTIPMQARYDIRDIGINYRNFRRERLWGAFQKDFVYHDKKKGIAIAASRDGAVHYVIFIPGKESHSLLCDQPEVRQYYRSNKWNRYPWMKDVPVDTNDHPEITALDLSETELLPDCWTTNNHVCSNEPRRIAVRVNAVDRENDPLTIIYKVSGGKIVGRGDIVAWDLSDVPPGSYTITAAADDGCGPCGKLVTKTVVVR
jgi:hypothetical protein